jgi:hypothetical protein
VHKEDQHKSSVKNDLGSSPLRTPWLSGTGTLNFSNATWSGSGFALIVIPEAAFGIVAFGGSMRFKLSLME